MSGDGRTASQGTPMIAQFQAIKAEHADCLLFFRMGDFYELFFDDAKAAATALDIALTRRGRHDGEDIPMCGVPVHSAEIYLERLIRRGFKVAICEQMEDPKAAKRRGAKAIVARDVVRVVTPGTLTEDTLLDARANNYLAALSRMRGSEALAWLDVSTGEVRTAPVADGALAAELARIAPGELLVADPALADDSLPDLNEFQDRITPLPGGDFDSIAGERILKRVYRVAELGGFGELGRAELGALGALLGYVERTQRGRLPHLGPPMRVLPGHHLVIDPATRANLELLRSLGGSRDGSLLAAVDRTVTGAGARLLTARLAAPLAEPARIRRRLDAVEAMADDPDLRARVRESLRGTPDLERALSRISLGRAGPRDLVAIRTGLERAAALRNQLADDATPLAVYAGGLTDLEDLAANLATTVADAPPLLARDGGFVRSGASEELDRERELRDHGRRLIVELERRLQGQTGIGSLKIRHNSMLGYYIEVTATHRDKVPEGFVQRQSMANATRYSTAELAELESRIAAAGERALAIELLIFERLLAAVSERAPAIARTAGALARLDLAAGLAELATERRYCRPQVDASDVFMIEGGRHPVVEQALAMSGIPFIANDADLGPERRLWLMTGPNMAGKSTFLRQNALIALMAQAGSFVPATRAHIGVVDRLFSRVGAADDLARGRSTFMVEMVETAAILNQATARSLVILDEIGRGTATWDGLSIAWAVVEHLHEATRCRALFATHYHELTALAARLDRLAVRTMRVKEWQGDVVFLHEVGEGAADRSYGIHVARLAGLPQPILKRAEEVLHRLEQGEANRAHARLADDLPLFSAAAARPSPAASPPAASPVEDALRTIHPDDLSPREALELLYRLKGLNDAG